MAEQRIINDEKISTVRELTTLMDEFPIVGIVNMENLPAKQLQNMRASLRGRIIIKMAKRRIIKLAIEKSKKENLKELENHLEGMPAMIFTKENPFKIYKILQKSKSSAPAKAGQKAPKDIIVPAGPTSFAPGPIIGELGQAGIKAGIEGGKVAIKADSLVAKKGEPIKEGVAKVLARLGVEPMEIGLNLVAVYEDKTIYPNEILAIDEVEFIGRISQASSYAYNLAFEIEYPAKEIIDMMIAKAHLEAKALAQEQEIDSE
jgi:large subunit ribosomal protein L10